MALRALAYAAATAALLAGSVDAAAVSKRQSITTLSTAQISTFKPFTFFASAAYCDPSVTLTWSCGANCNANPGFVPVASGGDGGEVQFWFVGFAPAQNTVIVSHQGTDTSDIVADLTDVSILRETLDPTLFPGVSSSITVHAGFAGSQSRSAAPVLAAVKAAMTTHSTKTVTVVGHSLGAAIALLDSVSLSLRLPSGTTVNTVVYGLPRVGNQAFADYVDAHQHVTHINNKKDPVPILPGRFLGFVHPSGEVHIQASNAWDACPGQDNTSNLCIVGDVPNIFDGTESDHDGPYDGVEMGC
ncbi:lipase class 3 family protein [Auriscalpium vulgare]|uniref:Lipase class 3 family protein n=1 Tax=Auriscalpium vulgare TaxID=40419 RepID=A0ACB8RTH8_9AGAM|nr:lipase class 3 family protein [Auriscalpium vulgare]